MVRSLSFSNSQQSRAQEFETITKRSNIFRQIRIRVRSKSTWTSWWSSQVPLAMSSLTTMVNIEIDQSQTFFKPFTNVIFSLGIPVKAFPEDKIPAVQYAALVADLVMKTKSTLKQLNQGDSDFVYLRMRTKQDTEMIVTDYIVPNSGNEYILVCLQQCKFAKEEEVVAEEKWNQQNQQEDYFTRRRWLIDDRYYICRACINMLVL